MYERTTQVEFTVIDRMVVADPCYIDKNDVKNGLEDSIDGLGALIGDCAGEWIATVELENDAFSDGRFKRVSKLIARRQGAERSTRYHSTSRRVAEAGVDSGQMFIGDAGSFGLDYDALLSRYSSAPYHEDQDNTAWNKGYDNNINFLGFAEGAVSSTGYGDGCYPVLVKYDDADRPVEVTVEFMRDEEEDEEDE